MINKDINKIKNQSKILLGKPLCKRADCLVNLFYALPFPSFLSIEFLSFN